MAPKVRTAPRSIAQDEEEGTTKRNFMPKKSKRSRKKLASFLKF